jgi:hypothetical protein
MEVEDVYDFNDDLEDLDRKYMSAPLLEFYESSSGVLLSHFLFRRWPESWVET